MHVYTILGRAHGWQRGEYGYFRESGYQARPYIQLGARRLKGASIGAGILKAIKMVARTGG